MTGCAARQHPAMPMGPEAEALRSSARGRGAFARLYFPLVLSLLALLSLVAFWDNIVSDVSQPSNSQPRMVVHGLFSFGWMVMLILQSLLVRTGNVRLHQRLGIAALLVAIGMTLSTIWVFIVAWTSWDAMAPHVQANRILLASFSLWIALAFLQRRTSDVHKRLMLSGTLFLMEPILSRAFDPLVGDFLPPLSEAADFQVFASYLVLTWSGLFASLFLYDRATVGRIHRVSLASYLWLLAVYAFVHVF
jgi:hypothetical protein